MTTKKPAPQSGKAETKRRVDRHGIPESAGQHHSYAVTYPEYGGKQYLSALPKPGKRNQYVPADDGKKATAGAGRSAYRSDSSGPETSREKDEKRYAKGGTVSRGYGLARSGKKCKMV